MAQVTSHNLQKSLGTWQVTVAGVALVVAASTLVSDFAGYFSLGWGFVIALGLAFVVNLLLGLSAASLSISFPRAGALYDYARALFRGQTGRVLGGFLGLSFFGMFAFAASGETAAGAFGFQALLHSGLSVRWFILALIVLATIPNILGIKTTAWVSAGLLLMMLGIRWFFGVAGFLGLGATGAWDSSHLHGGLSLLGETGILSAGLALAFWSFVGIEFACSLAEEVGNPRKAMPRGIVLGLIAILATSLVMGIGVTGTLPLEQWQAAAAGELGRGGEAPQLAVGQLMFGSIGFSLMALASVAATLGTLTVAMAAMPRILYSIARDNGFFGPLSKLFGRLHPRFGTPVAATVATAILYTIPAVYSSQVVDWLYSAAYAWVVLYVIMHVLATINKLRTAPVARRTYRFGIWTYGTIAVSLTLGTLYFAFAGGHLEYGSRALIVLALAAIATVVSEWLRSRAARIQNPAPQQASQSTVLHKAA